MKKFLLLIALMGVVQARAQEPPVAGVSPATPTPVLVIKKWSVSIVPWDAWFKDNALVTDKTEYVHFFWNAQDFKVNFEVKDKKIRLAEAALELVKRLYPTDAKADQVKVDIVYVLERDAYGMPKWDSLQQVAHLEFLRSKASKLTKHRVPLSEIQMKKFFGKYEIY